MARQTLARRALVVQIAQRPTPPSRSSAGLPGKPGPAPTDPKWMKSSLGSKAHALEAGAPAPRHAKEDVPPSGDGAEDPGRDPHAFDFGSFAVLAGELAEEMRQRRIVLTEGLEDAEAVVQSTDRESVEIPTEATGAEIPDGAAAAPEYDPKEYWNTVHALDAEEYLRDVVYGGVDGLVYVRNLAEFVATAPLDVGERAEDEDGDEDVDMEDSASSLPLGSTLPSWVAQNVVGPLTDSRHALLQRTALELIAPTLSFTGLRTRSPPTPISTTTSSPAMVSTALHVRPRAAAALAALLQIYTQKIDMASLIRTPAEVEHEQSEKEWAGKGLAQNGPAEMNSVLDHVAGVICRLQAERTRRRRARIREAEIEPPRRARAGTKRAGAGKAQRGQAPSPRARVVIRAADAPWPSHSPHAPPSCLPSYYQGTRPSPSCLPPSHLRTQRTIRTR
ncbi:hypothetical protein DFH06DRAFT_1426675 [Mycena polygramma]|nr:hypothetical protein DFH06DRAFT_1426675 [Mycena polygramma]